MLLRPDVEREMSPGGRFLIGLSGRIRSNIADMPGGLRHRDTVRVKRPLRNDLADACQRLETGRPYPLPLLVEAPLGSDAASDLPTG